MNNLQKTYINEQVNKIMITWSAELGLIHSVHSWKTTFKTSLQSVKAL